MNLQKSRKLFQKDSRYKCQFGTKVHEPSRLVSQVGTKYKDKVLHVPGSNQNTETSCKNKLKLTKPKDLFFKKDECTQKRGSKTETSVEEI